MEYLSSEVLLVILNHSVDLRTFMICYALKCGKEHTDEEQRIGLGVEIWNIEPLDNIGVCRRAGKPPGIV